MSTSLSSHKSETQLSASEATLVSSTSSEAKFLGVVTLTNTSESNVEATLWLLPTDTTGTTGSGGNWTWKETIPAGRTVFVDKLMGHVLGPSMKVSGLAGTASVINVNISGTTET
jgi:hypothetical protein